MDAVRTQIHQLFYADQVDQAVALLNSLTGEQITSEIAKLEEDQIYLQHAKQLLNSSEWRLVSSRNNVVVESKGSANEFFCRATTSVEAGLFPVISVIAEVELLHNWVPNATDYQIFFEPTDFRKCVRYKFWFPWPFSNRDCFLECVGVPVPEENAALIILRSPRESTYLGQEIPGARESTAKLDMEILIFYVKAVDETHTDFTLILKAQPHLNYIPSWLINYGMKTIVHQMIVNMRYHIQHFSGSPYEEAVNRKQEFYSHISSLIKEYIN